MRTLNELIKNMQNTDLVIARYLPSYWDSQSSILELKNERIHGGKKR